MRRVASLQDPATRLLRPAIALRVGRAIGRRPGSTAEGTAPAVPVR